MKLTRVLVSSLVLSIAGTSTSLFAQPEKAPATENGKGDRKGAGRGAWMSPEERADAIDKAVGGLTADQKKQIVDILTKSRDQMQGLAPEERREKGREIMTETNAKIRGVLTPEQQKKFDEMPRPGRGGPGGGGQRKSQ